MSMAPSLLHQYPNRYFIETGSLHGHTIEHALNAGFAEVRSIELAEVFYNECVARFKDDRRVKLYHGDSADLLAQVIADLDEGATFWLDGHWSGPESSTAKGKKVSPLLEELAAIAKHPIRHHTILIDDMTCWVPGNKLFDGDDFTCLDIITALRSINPDYRIEWANGAYVADDILIARP